MKFKISQQNDWFPTPYLTVFNPNAGKYGPENSEYGHFSGNDDHLTWSNNTFLIFMGELSQEKLFNETCQSTK